MRMKIFEVVEKVTRKLTIEAKGDKIDRFGLEVRTSKPLRAKKSLTFFKCDAKNGWGARN